MTYSFVVGVLTFVVGVSALGLALRTRRRDALARAWAYGYTTRSYDDITGMVSPNPYNQEYPLKEARA